MNKADARATWTAKGYIGEFRLSWRSDFLPVLKIAEGGRKDGPEYFATKEAAELEAWRTMNRIEQTAMVRDGEKCGTYRDEIERRYFSKGKEIEVERRSITV